LERKITLSPTADQFLKMMKKTDLGHCLNLATSYLKPAENYWSFKHCWIEI